MATPKQTFDKDGLPIHYSVGAIIEKDGKYLLIDRTKTPFGFASVAGHIDSGESPETALVREVLEESGLNISSLKLLEEELLAAEGVTCSRGVVKHHWYVYLCDVSGDVVWNKEETKSIGWYSRDDIKKLPLEQAWEYWFKKIGITPS